MSLNVWCLRKFLWEVKVRADSAVSSLASLRRTTNLLRRNVRLVVLSENGSLKLCKKRKIVLRLNEIVYVRFSIR